MKHASEPGTSRGGFVIFFVLLMMFAISITAVTGYLVVNSEFSLSNHAKEGAEVISVAHGGMQHFLADQTGVVGDSVVYEIGLGIAIVTSRKLMEKDSLNHLYYLRSEGTLNDIRTPGAPVARRVVGAFVWHRLRPLAHRAAVIISADRIDAFGAGDIDGDDHSSASDCPGLALADITGGIAKVNLRGNFDGGSAPDEEYLEWVLTDMADSLGIRWDVLQDPKLRLRVRRLTAELRFPSRRLIPPGTLSGRSCARELVERAGRPGGHRHVRPDNVLQLDGDRAGRLHRRHHPGSH